MRRKTEGKASAVSGEVSCAFRSIVIADSVPS
jgi:hypothetical protein